MLFTTTKKIELKSKVTLWNLLRQILIYSIVRYLPFKQIKRHLPTRNNSAAERGLSDELAKWKHIQNDCRKPMYQQTFNRKLRVGRMVEFAQSFLVCLSE